MKQIIDDYSPILDGVEVEELKSKVLEAPKQTQQSSDENPLHLDDATDGEDIPVAE